MVRFVVAAVCVFLPQHLPGQGQLILDNKVNNVVVAPVYGQATGKPHLALTGNTPGGTPPGVQTYQGAPLSGSNFTFQLFAGPTNIAPRLLPALSPSVVFQSSGFVVPPTHAVVVGGVADGQRALVQARAWNNRGGTITNWSQVLADPTIPRGLSQPFISEPLGGLFRPPPNLIGLRSFNLALPGQSVMMTPIMCDTGWICVRFRGEETLTYEVEAAQFVTNWTTLGTATHAGDGIFEYRDHWPGPGRRFYRALHPAE